MEEQFIPYELALELEELGFKEECMSIYLKSTKTPYPMYRPFRYKQQSDELLRPLWQQAFDFFRKKYNIDKEIRSYRHTPIKYYECYIDDINNKTSYGGIGKSFTYEEARLECLKYLIKLVKNN